MSMLFGNDGDDWLIGGDGADGLHGGLDNDRMDGGAGNDSLMGNSGDDVLNGDEGDDALFGSLGNDVLRGGAGSDSLSGGSGADRFMYDAVGNGVDVITDFGTGDVLAIGNLLSGFAAGREADFVRLLGQRRQHHRSARWGRRARNNRNACKDLVLATCATGSALAALVNAGQIDFLIA